MRKFLVYILFFFLIIVGCDWAVGKVCYYLLTHASGGTTYRINYIPHKTEEDILIMGSSRAFHHYDSEVLMDSLNRTVYNCGQDGSGIIYSYGAYQLITKRYNPQLIIYEVTPEYDLFCGNNFTALSRLRFFYGEAEIDSIFQNVEPTECYKLQSQMYKYNMNYIRFLIDYIHPTRNYAYGFDPVDGEMSYEPVIESKPSVFEFDSVKLAYLEKLVNACQQQQIQLIFAASPLYKNETDQELAPIKRICEEYQIPFLNYFCDSTFNNHKKFFKDSYHLNREGAKIYTQKIASEVKSFLLKE